MSSETQYVVDIMTPNPVVVGPDMTAWAADCLARERGVHYLLVMDRYRLVGVVCDCDLSRVGATVRVGFCMRRDPTTIDDQRTAASASALMEKRAIGCLPVVDWSGALRGVVTRHDLHHAGIAASGADLTCASCGSSHGLVPPGGSSDEALVRFCARCVDQGRQPRSALDEHYFTLGGGD